MSALAYVNHGRWVADCTRPYCSGAEALTPKQLAFHCSNCHQLDEITWPHNADEIFEVLAERPVPQTRNWYPLDHPLALKFKLPHGQSVEDLIWEEHEHETGDERY